jgi:hypothetical protein
MYNFEGSACILVSSRYFGSDPVEEVNDNHRIRISSGGGADIVKLEFMPALRVPERANHVRVVLPSGLMIAGTPMQAEVTKSGGWMTINVEEKALEYDEADS